jgi:protein tyrosine/serine phosphatase
MVVAADRQPAWIELTGAHNVRDLSGLPAGARQVRAGILTRSDHLDDVTPEDLVVLRDVVGLRAVIDLRTPAEAATPAPWLEDFGVAHLHLPLIDLTGTTDPRQLRAEFGADQAAVYRRMLTIAAPEIARILRFLLEPGHAPAVIHCAAGKDRTGITVAVLLAVAGVDEPAIVADYLATGERLDRVREALQRRAFYRDMDISDSSAMTAAPILGVLDALRELGGAAEYLRAQGLSEQDLDQWRIRLLEPAA